MTIRRMLMTCLVPKATDTHSVYNIYCFSTATTANASQCYVILTVHVLLIPKVTREDNTIMKFWDIRFDEAVLEADHVVKYISCVRPVLMIT